MTTYVMRSTRDGVVAEASIEIASDQRFADFTIVVDRRRPGGRWKRVAELEGADGTLLAAVVIARGMLASALVCTITGTEGGALGHRQID